MFLFPVERFLRECHHGRRSDNRPRRGAAKNSCKVAKIFEIKDAQTFEVLEKRRVDHCLVSMEGLAEGQAGARLACGEVAAAIIHLLDN